MPRICEILDMPSHSDSRGNLVVMEKVLPFDVKRIYWIYDADGQTRGGHRHLKTRQGLIAINGSVRVDLERLNQAEQCFLNSPKQCLLIEPEVWHWMTFSRGAILLVLASEYYEKTDYLHKEAKL